MMKNENFLLELLKLGKAKFENGQVIIFNASNIVLPTRSFLFLGKLLSEKYGVEESARILKEVGKFQIKQALVRYKELFDIEKMEKRKFFEFGTKIGELLGLGEFEVKEKIVRCRNNPIAMEYKLMFGQANEPVDFYLCSIWEEAFKAYLGKPVEVKETKCIACGDPYCKFEVFPAEEKKETKT
jgi:predicted hydrocarbon binding protein